MLRSVWDKAVKTYQAVRQDMSRDAVRALDERIAAARDGYNLYVEHFAYGAAQARILEPVSAQTAAVLVERATADRQKILAAMDTRRNRFNLDF